MGYLKERYGIEIAPLAKGAGVCEVCGRKHKADQPHDRSSLYYQYRFFDENGRFASWADAMEHCSCVTKMLWRQHLEARGIDPDKIPETMMTTVTVEAG